MPEEFTNNLVDLMEWLGGLGLDEVELKILGFIFRHKSDHDGNSPSLREIAAHLRYSVSSTHYWVQKLIDKGYLKRVHNKLETGGVWEPNEELHSSRPQD